MEQRKPHWIRVYNATFEKWDVPVHSRVWTFEPRSETLVDERYVWPIEKEHKDKGLIVINDGDNKAEREKEALMNYRQQLIQRIKNFQLSMDEYKKKGVTLEKHDQMKLAEKWLSEINQRYSVEAKVMQVENSFLNVPVETEKKIETPVVPAIAKMVHGIGSVPELETFN
jgi:hypothetical protein